MIRTGQFMTDDQINKRMQFLAIICVGGMHEGFDYSRQWAELMYLGEVRRNLGYCGGFVPDYKPEEATP